MLVRELQEFITFLNGVRGKRWYIQIHFNIVLCEILRLRITLEILYENRKELYFASKIHMLARWNYTML